MNIFGLPGRVAAVASALVAGTLLGGLTLASPARAGFITLTGSDADTFHGNTQFATQMRDHLKLGSSLDLLVLGDASATAAFSGSVGGVGITTTSTLAAITLPNFSGLYLLSDSATDAGCCQADVARISGFEAAISSFVAAGGNFGIQAYTGSPGFDLILGTSGGANADVFGAFGGAGGPLNYNDETVTAAGLAAGFTNVDPPLDSWGHQGFRTSAFSSLGFVSLFDASVYGSGVAGVLSTIPEPSTALLLASGLAAMAVGSRRRPQ